MKQSPTYFTLPAGRRAHRDRASSPASTGWQLFLEIVIACDIGFFFALMIWLAL